MVNVHSGIINNYNIIQPTHVLDTAWYGKVCHWLAGGWKFSTDIHSQIQENIKDTKVVVVRNC